MLIITHRINTIKELANVPNTYGVEIDVRHDNRTGRLYLHHDPQTAGKGLEECADLETYLAAFRQAFIVINVKEAGIEGKIIELAAQYSVSPDRYFLLDVEFPFFYGATRGTRADGLQTKSIAVRYSEAEPLEMALAQKGFVDWVWIDTNTCLPLDENTGAELAKNFKTCLVSPDRWRSEGGVREIPEYRRKMEKIGFRLDAVMVGLEHAALWQ